MGLKLSQAVILMWNKVGISVLVFLLVALVLSSTGVYAQTNGYQGDFTAKTSEDGRNFKAYLSGPVEVEKGNVSMGAYAVDDMATDEYSVNVLFTGSYDYKSGKVSGIANGTYDKGAIVDEKSNLWDSCIDKGVGTWSGNVDPDTGIGNGTYAVTLTTSTYYSPKAGVGGLYSADPVKKSRSETITGTWETKFQISKRDILKWYTDFGNSQQTWPDGTVDQKALVGPSNSSYKNNFWSFWGYTTYKRYTCTAIQWKTLYFLNQLKRDGKLVGWDYIPVDGWLASGYPVHNTVALWPHGDKLEDGIILDAHDPNSAWSYDASYVREGYLGIGKYVGCPWHPKPGDGYDDVYPGFGIVSKYELVNFQFCTEPWNQQGMIYSGLTSAKSMASSGYTTVKSKIKSSVTYIIGLKCPIDVLIVNSKGERIGELPNGEMVLEFEPVSIYFWVNDEGEKEWVFSLPDDTYEIQITGTDSGNFHLLTGVPGEYAHDYGYLPTTPGAQAILTLSPEKGEELTLADGSKPSFSSITPGTEEAGPDEIIEQDEAYGNEIGDARTWYNEGVALDDSGRYEEAIECYDRAIEIDPRYAKAFNNRGADLLSLKRYDDAIKSFGQAIDIDPDYKEAWNNKGVALGHQGEFEDAIDCFEEAIEIDPFYGEAWNNMGNAHYYLGNYEDALYCYDMATTIDISDSNAWRNKGHALQKLGRNA